MLHLHIKLGGGGGGVCKSCSLHPNLHVGPIDMAYQHSLSGLQLQVGPLVNYMDSTPTFSKWTNIH